MTNDLAANDKAIWGSQIIYVLTTKYTFFDAVQFQDWNNVKYNDLEWLLIVAPIHIECG